MAQLSHTQLEEMYRTMFLIRAFEEKVDFFFSRGMIHGTAHLYSGEEATAVGVCSALRDDDLITSTHRGHGHCIAKGIDLGRMMAELLGKRDGYCKGKGGSMHIADVSRGNLGANGIVGGGIPIAVGAALTLRLRERVLGEKTDQIVVCFFGDGALNQGSFHESVNLAAVWDLPVVFVCENNQYAMSLSNKRAFKLEKPADRALGYGIPGWTVDGNDVLAVHEMATRARAHVRKHGPVMIVAETYRQKGHSKSDANRYRSKEEMAEWLTRDPLPRFRSVLQEAGISEARLNEIEAAVRDDLEHAVAFAEASEYPPIDSILEDVYA
ncbi:MAG: thiamine pyrophosphate-dependent dehydrogenase E1 component subunit alpha [Spirochaetaceae bacterium]|nr:thiamine pyrophosphate-dependent dehydrogenase E1 component subunit alpha [Spirochaetaceae bacterium]